jgi:hypothetical protein
MPCLTKSSCNMQVDRPVGDYTKSRGLPTAAAVQLQRQRFGSNSLHIPIPKFQEIFCKQMLGPVPVFQVHCLPTSDACWVSARTMTHFHCVSHGRRTPIRRSMDLTEPRSRSRGVAKLCAGGTLGAVYVPVADGRVLELRAVQRLFHLHVRGVHGVRPPQEPLHAALHAQQGDHCAGAPSGWPCDARTVSTGGNVTFAHLNVAMFSTGDGPSKTRQRVPPVKTRPEDTRYHLHLGVYPAQYNQTPEAS